MKEMRPLMDTLIKNTQKAYELCLEMPGKRLAFFDVLLPEIIKVAEAAKAERSKEILEMLPRGFLATLNTASLRKAYGHGFWECLDEVKALINNQKEDASHL